MFSVGDLSGARVMLERAAKAGNADAALLLGGTYDPTLFNRFEPGGDAVDAVTARTWYEMAKRLGSLEARRRLNALTRRAPWSDLPSRP